MDAVDVDAAGDHGTPGRAGYRRSAGSPRGEARRRDLLDRVADDLAVNGLVDFSLRRAARAAGTTHKVLLYYFDGANDLLTQATFRLRERRIGNALAAATEGPADRPLAVRVRAVWPVLVGGEGQVLDQAIGLAMYDPERYAELGRESALPDPAVRAAQQAPHAELIRLPGGHYAPFLEAHAQAVDAELDFLRRHLTDGRPPPRS